MLSNPPKLTSFADTNGTEGNKPDNLALSQAIAAYLPELMVADLLQNPVRLAQPAHFEAVTLVMDITGFTPLSEKLAKKGREGAEQVTALVNGFFSQVLGEVRRQGGVIAKFGGDAFNAFFVREASHSWEEVAQRALHSAFALQALVVNYQHLRLSAEESGTGREEVFRLYAKVGLGAGAILAFGVGDPMQHCDFLFAGTPFNGAAEAEHHANPGDIIAHQAFLECSAGLEPFLELGEKRENCRPVLACAGLAPAPVPPLFDLSGISQAERETFLSRGAAFVPRALYERLKLGYPALPGEHRRVVSLFVNFEGFGWLKDETAPARFQEYYLAVQAEVQRYRGHLNRISSGDKGDVLHIIFGAPVTHQDDDEQAVRCALALQEVAHRHNLLSQRIGLSSGFVFAGETGSLDRYEYTVMGDTVNLSARLMQLAAPWTVLLDTATAAHLKEKDFELGPFRPVMLKGKREAVEVGEVLGLGDNEETLPGLPVQTLAPLYGRETEMAQAANWLITALSGTSLSLAVSGEPGIGKSFLLARLMADWRVAGGRVCRVSVQSYELGAFRLWAKWLADLLRLKRKATPAERGNQLSAAIAQLLPDLAEWSPLWGELLDLDMNEPGWLRALDRPTRRQRLAEFTPRLLAALARRQPLLLLCDDAHQADSASLELLDQVLPALRDVPILLALGYRAEQKPALALLKSRQCLHLALTALPPAASQQLIEAELEVLNTTVEPSEREAFVAAVSKLTGGNPFFITELISTLQSERGLANVIAHSAAPLSYNLETVIMARLDALESRLREVVLAAAVVGGYFSEEVIRPLLPSGLAHAEANEKVTPLNQLCRLDLLQPTPTPDGLVYRFRHALIQQVAYDSLPFARRRDLHEEIGRYFENSTSRGQDQLERLAYHYERSLNHLKAVLYLSQSAERSARLFANQEALRQYQSAFQKAVQAGGQATPNLAQLLTGIGDVQAQTAAFDPALLSYAQAFELTPEQDALERARLEQKRCEVLVRATRLPDALAAIERAETQLATLTSRKHQPKVNLARAQLAELYSTILRQQSNFASASQWAETGLQLLEGHTGRQPGAAMVKIKLYQALAATVAVTGQLKLAESSIAKALRLSQRLDDPVTEGQLQLRLGILAMQQEHLNKAPDFYRRALPMIEKTGSCDRLAQALVPGSLTFLLRGDYAEAREWGRRGLKLAEEVGTPFSICTVQFVLAWLDTVVGKWEEALMQYEQSTVLARQHGLWLRVAEFLFRQAEVFIWRGQYGQAEDLLQQSLALAEQHKLPIHRKQAYLVLAKNYYDQGLFEKGAECLVQLEFEGEREITSRSAAFWLWVGEWYALSTLNGQTSDQLGTASEIGQQVRAALAYLQASHSKLWLPHARRINGMMAWVEGRLPEAARHFNQGLALARTTGHLPETARLLAWRSRFALATKPASLQHSVTRDLREAATLLEKLGAWPELKQVQEMLVSRP